MTVNSVLFRTTSERVPDEAAAAPDYFVDLNLDQVVGAITAGKEGYNLAPFYWSALHDVDDVTFRHAIMQDVEDPILRGNIRDFAQSMRTVRECLAMTEKRGYQRQIERWFLDAAHVYCCAVTRLSADLSARTLTSRGLQDFREYLSRYLASERFVSISEQGKQLKAELSAIRYSVLIHGLRLEVRGYEREEDYSAEVEAAFARFSQGDVPKRTFNFNEASDMNHIEARVLDLVAQLYQDTFSKLAEYRAAHSDFRDPDMVKFDKEIQFYVAYLEYISRFKEIGLSFCYPRISQTNKEVYSREGFDLALAGAFLLDNTAPVTNDLHLKGPERIIVVTGPNQGGKTTFARTFGQLHHLASLGCPTPGSEAQLYLPDGVFTHFERQEDMASLRGKLEDDLVRMHSILAAATSRSIIIINEMFSSTTLQDAVTLSQKVAASIMELDVLCIWVTFIEEVASLSEKVVSMASSVQTDDMTVRTFKVVRKPSDGLAYASSVAEKYRLSYDRIKERLE